MYSGQSHPTMTYQFSDFTPPLHQWTKIKVSQKIDGLYYKMTFTTGATKARYLANPRHGAELYASNPWEGAQVGSIRNLHLINGNGGDFEI